VTIEFQSRGIDVAVEVAAAVKNGIPPRAWVLVADELANGVKVCPCEGIGSDDVSEGSTANVEFWDC
jgi:hypothetical protein